MENKLRSIVRYIVKNYPYPDELTKTRITKLVYLIDWENIKKNNKQITDINWYYDHYGPYVSDVLDEADKDDCIRIESTISNFGTLKYIVRAKVDKAELIYNNLTDEEVSIIEKVIQDTKAYSWNKFIDYVYSTEPIKESDRYNSLDLIKFRDYI